MTRRFIILDEQFGRWTVLSYAGQRYWKCRCQCGTVKEVCGSTLRRGTSTGCLKCKKGRNPKHGGRRTRLYTIWCRMIGRCENPNDPAFGRYGDRGIKIYRAWRQSFVTFREWAVAHGYTAHLTLDRIDNDKGYGPDNCRWATYKQQNRNRRDNRPIRYYGRLVLISELAERAALPADVVKNRIRRYGWSVRRALKTPVAKRELREPWIAAGMSKSSWYRHRCNIDDMPKEAAA
jgi:hypothetical protein